MDGGVGARRRWEEALAEVEQEDRDCPTAAPVVRQTLDAPMLPLP